MGMDWFEGEEQKESLRKDAEEYATAAGWMSQTTQIVPSVSGQQFFRYSIAARPITKAILPPASKWARIQRIGLYHFSVRGSASRRLLSTWTSRQLMGEYGTHVITKVMRDVWATRISSKYGEKEKAVGGTDLGGPGERNRGRPGGRWAGVWILPSLSVSDSGSFSVYNRIYIFAMPTIA